MSQQFPLQGVPVWRTQYQFQGMQPLAPPTVQQNEVPEIDAHTRNANVDMSFLKNQIIVQAAYCFHKHVEDFYKDSQGSPPLKPTDVFEVLFESSRLVPGQFRAVVVTTRPWSAPTIVLQGNWKWSLHEGVWELFEKLAEISEKEVMTMKARSLTGSERK